MAHLRISIDTDNAAFADGNLGDECARILRVAANQLALILDPESGLARPGDAFPLYDINGNKVGQYALSAE
jgi:hypothetical protein